VRLDGGDAGTTPRAGELMMRCTRLCGTASVILAWLASAGSSAAAPPRDARDWRDEIVYFAMIDRFDDGEPRNNDHGAGEFDPTSGAHYSGGDLAGLTRRLDYIRGLGATALWITPPVRHQWWDGEVGYGGYHGYWGEHFAEVDPHFGELRDYRALADGLHARDMRLIQDIVVNHTGNYFSYPAGHDARDPVRGHRRNPAPGAHAAPTQWPFSLNDAREPAQRAADIYHWTPVIADFGDPRQELTYQLASLDDLNTANPVVRRALRASYGHWIRAVGVDGFRVDTAFYVEPEFFRDFLHADDARAPGVMQVAREAGRAPFHVFGEGFGVDAPYQEVQARKIERWSRDADGTLLPAMINSPHSGRLLDVCARGRAPAVLAHRIDSMMKVHAQPHLMPTFVDNHDVDRFLAGGDASGLQLALLAIHTLPGIPTIYYGTEQGLVEPRAAMFAHGYGSGGRDRFDATAPMYRRLRELATLRRTHRVFSRGTPRVLHAEPAGPGAFVHAMQHEGVVALVALNTATHAALLDDVDTGLAPGTRLLPIDAFGTEAADLGLDARGRFTRVLPPRSAQVWLAGDASSATGSAPPMPQIDPTTNAPARDVLELSGSAAGLDDLHLVLDGDATRALPVTVAAEGRWQARVDVSDLIDPAIEHRVVAWSPSTGRVSAPLRFRVAPQWRTRLVHEDPAGDDHGPDAHYTYPTGALWRAHRPADLRRVTLSTSGASLRIAVQLADVVAAWNPPQGFDHVAITAFVELPGRGDGVRAMPGQHASLPADMQWHVRARVGGWSNVLTSARAADARHEGTPAPVGATLTLDRAGDTITITLPASALGHPRTLAGARVYLSTWDYDGGFRDLGREAAPFAFGGGTATQARVMDDTGILTLPPD
jgi:glycosidase